MIGQNARVLLGDVLLCSSSERLQYLLREVIEVTQGRLEVSSVIPAYNVGVGSGLSRVV